MEIFAKLSTHVNLPFVFFYFFNDIYSFEASRYIIHILVESVNAHDYLISEIIQVNKEINRWKGRNSGKFGGSSLSTYRFLKATSSSTTVDRI